MIAKVIGCGKNYFLLSESSTARPQWLTVVDVLVRCLDDAKGLLQFTPGNAK